MDDLSIWGWVVMTIMAVVGLLVIVVFLVALLGLVSPQKAGMKSRYDAAKIAISAPLGIIVLPVLVGIVVTLVGAIFGLGLNTAERTAADNAKYAAENARRARQIQEDKQREQAAAAAAHAAKMAAHPRPDEIDRLGSFAVHEVMETYQTRWPVMRAAEGRFGFTTSQKTEFWACLITMSGDLQYRTIRLDQAVEPCKVVAFRVRD